MILRFVGVGSSDGGGVLPPLPIVIGNPTEGTPVASITYRYPLSPTEKDPWFTLKEIELFDQAVGI